MLLYYCRVPQRAEQIHRADSSYEDIAKIKDDHEYVNLIGRDDCHH